MITRRLFVLWIGMVSLFASLALQAQDDMYGQVRFTNESGQAVKLKVWNPRTENGSFEATVENGKSTLLTGKDGKPLHVGLGSSRIQINGMDPKGVSEVASRKGDTYEIVWTKDGFKPRAKE